MLTGCSLLKLSPDLDAFGRHAIQLLAGPDSAAISAAIDPELRTEATWLEITKLRQILADLHADSTALVGWNIVSSPEGYSVGLSYELHGTGWELVRIAASGTARGAPLRITGFHYQPLTASLAELNAFRLTGKSWRQYLVLVSAIVFLIISVSTAVAVIRSGMPQRWLWAFVAVTGVGVCGIDWTSGESYVRPLYVQLFGAAFARAGPVAPWVISCAIPVGAAAALWKRDLFLKHAARPAERPAPEHTTG
ncbi:MAG: hypothetical protein ABI765_02625 [Gemmatimonadota bacterium]